jgi:uncharacterized membrane protein
MTGLFEYAYGMIRFMIVCGIVIAVIAIAMAVILCAVAGAVASGILSPTRTVRGQLRLLDLTIQDGAAELRALRQGQI